MECPVCYTDNCNCRLTCGHSFCRPCVKEWYMKTDSEPSCPMCRNTLYFKGMNKVAEKWEEEFEEQKWEEVYNDALDSTLEEFEDAGVMDGESIKMFMEDLQMAYQKLRKMYDQGFDLDWSDIREILRHPYCMEALLISQSKYTLYDDFEDIWRRNMFVSKYPGWKGPGPVWCA